MTGFSPDHDRLVAIEFFLTRLLADRCLEQPDPMAAAEQEKAAAEAYGDALVASASGKGNDEGTVLAIEIGGALGMIADDLLAEVRARLADG